MAMNRAMADRVGLAPGDRMLDAGCGVGGTAVWAAQRRGARVVGITIVPDQVERARRLTRERGLQDRVSFEVRDFLDTGFDDASFDVVWAQESAVHAPGREAFLTEVFRVLRPGARLVASDYVRSTVPADADGQRLLAEWRDGWALADLITAEHWLKALSGAGFVGARIEDVSANVARSLRRLHRISATLYPGSVLLHAAGLRDDAAQGNIRASVCPWRTLRLGLWFYGIVSGHKPH